MNGKFSNDYLLDKKVKIFQPIDGYRASTDAVLLAAAVDIASGKKIKILDVGSGTGAVSLCLAQRCGGNKCEIHGLELQPELAALANYSAQENNFDFVHFFNEDIRGKINCEQVKPCEYNVVVTNPPYSENDMPSPNQSKATAHNHSQFSLRQWLLFCLKMTRPFGRIYMINRVEALPVFIATLHESVGGITILPIYSKENQEAKRIIVMAQKDSKSPCRILKPFVTHSDEGSYTDKAQQILRGGKSFKDLAEI